MTALRDADLGYGWVPWARGPLWRLDEEYHFCLEVDGVAAAPAYCIPAGYEFNKASIPPLFWSLGYTPDGLVTVPALEHDFLCDLLTGGSHWLRERLPSWLLEAPPAWAVHEHFERRCLEWGMRPRKARLFGLTVKLLGPGGRLRLGQGKREKEEGKRVGDGREPPLM
jgi:hypothetical protein